MRPVVQRLLLTSGRRWPLIEFNRVSVRVFDEVGSINDACRWVARLRNALSHFSTIRNDDDDGAEFGGARFNFAFANDNQRVSADIARHAEKIFDRLTLCGNFGADFQPKHICIELPGALEVADTNSETRNSNGLYVLWDGRNDGSYLCVSGAAPKKLPSMTAAAKRSERWLKTFPPMRYWFLLGEPVEGGRITAFGPAWYLPLRSGTMPSTT